MSHYSAITIFTDPAFMAKNQFPGFFARSFKIPSLTAFVGSDERDKLLCPFRVLRFYLDKTKGGRGPRSRLFLPI